MSDTPSITEAAHERGSDGQLLPVSDTVEVHGQEYEVDILPATTGQRNEWTARLENEPEELSDEVTADLLDEFAAYDPSDFGASDWTDVRPGIVDALSHAILAHLFDVGSADEFREALEEADEAGSSGNPD